MLESQREELVRLGYAIVNESPYEVVGVRNKWHWDAFATNITYVVFVRATGPLQAGHILAEQDRMIAQANEVDPSRLPRGLQHGRCIIALYVADAVLPDARQFCESKQPMRFSTQFFPVALDRSTGESFYLRTTPIWGGIYFSKLRYVAEALVQPGATTGHREPVSWFGAIYGGCLVLLVLASCALTALVFTALAAS